MMSDEQMKEMDDANFEMACWSRVSGFGFRVQGFQGLGFRV